MTSTTCLTAILLSSDHLLLSARPSDASFADLMEIKRNANRAAVLVRQLARLFPQADHAPDRAQHDRRPRRSAHARRPHDRHECQGWKSITVAISGRCAPISASSSRCMLNLAVNARDAMPSMAASSRYARATCRHRKSRPSEPARTAGGRLSSWSRFPTRAPAFRQKFSTRSSSRSSPPRKSARAPASVLSMVYGIVKQSGGYIYPESEVGKGTTFRILLPRHIDIPEAAGEPTAGRIQWGGGAGRRLKLSHEASRPRPRNRPTSPATRPSSFWWRTKKPSAAAASACSRPAATPCTRQALASKRSRSWRSSNGAVDIVVSDVVMPEMDGPTLLDANSARTTRT